jgi:hypothetical protein
VRALAILLLLAACGEAERAPDTPGARLEAAAIARGLVPDPTGGTLTGIWASEADRMCIVPAGADMRLGVSVDYGEGQACAGSGSLRRDGDRLRVELTDCRFDASFDGERIMFPAELPQACQRLCTGRASLSALRVERLSESASEAATLRGTGGQPLCGS